MSHAVRIWAFICSVLLLTTPCNAGAPLARGQLLVRPVIGMATPSIGFKGTAKTGYIAGIAVDYMVTGHVSAGLEVSGTRFRVGSCMRVIWPGQVASLASARYLLNGAGNLRLYVTNQSRANPFVELGGGAYWAKFIDSYSMQFGSYVARVINRVVPGFHLAGGLDSDFNRLARAVMTVSYHWIKNPDGSGWRQYWTVSLGLAFQFRPI